MKVLVARMRVDFDETMDERKGKIKATNVRLL